MQKAKVVNLSKGMIESAIKKGAGKLAGGALLLAKTCEETMNRNEIILKYCLYIACFFVLAPILFTLQDIWDGRVVFAAFHAEDMTILKKWFTQYRWDLQYYMYLSFDWMQNLTGLSYKLWANIVSCASLLGIAFEVNRLMRDELKLEREYCLLGVLTILVFPPWATLMSSVLTFHISCIWAFLLAVRFRNSFPIIALPLFVYSLSLHSIFAFAVGYAVFNGVMTVDKSNWKMVGRHVVLISLGLVTIFAAYRHFFPPLGLHASYNGFNPRWIGFLNYAVIAMSVAAFTRFVLARNESQEERQVLYRRVLACLILLFFAGLAYWYVGRPIKVEGTNSFTPRHAYLTSIPMAMLVALLSQYGARRLGKKIAYTLVGAVLLLSFFYQFAAFQQKYTQLLYEDILLMKMKDIETPAPGIIYIDSKRKQTPKYIRDFCGLKWAFVERFGQDVWHIKVCTDKPGCTIPDVEKKKVGQYLVETSGTKASDLKVTRLVLLLDNFDAFGNPLYYYYYYSKDYERFNPRLEIVGVEEY